MTHLLPLKEFRETDKPGPLLTYGHEGGYVEVSAKEEKRQITITIQDDGSGISEAQQTHIFDRFYRGGNSQSPAGNGLGLAITAQIVALHNGTIAVESEEGKGSVFTLSFY